MRFRRLPGGTAGYWECSSCHYAEGKPPEAEIEAAKEKLRIETPLAKSPRQPRQPARPRASRSTVDEDIGEEHFNSDQQRLNEIILRASTPLSAGQIQDLIERGLVSTLRGQYHLTPDGQQALHISQGGEGPLSADEVGFFRLLTYRPRQQDLAKLEEQGYITLKDAQPALTPKGEAIRERLKESYDHKVEQSKARAKKVRRVSRNRY
jgi:predicted transcriptional regulator